ncbi:unnamed protein product, partial [marine sediment metagenome]
MNPNISTITDSEAQKLVTEATKNTGTDASIRKTTRNITTVFLMLDAGLRVGELVKLTINKLLAFGEPVESVSITSDMTKNKQARVVPLTARCKGAIKMMNCLIWQLDNCALKDYAFYNHTPSNPLTTR